MSYVSDEPSIRSRCDHDHDFPSPELFEKAFTQSLRDFFPIRNKYPDPRAEFYALYQRESQEYDKEFIKKYDDDLNTTLIFSGLFSAVASGFIIDAQTNLQEDYTQTTATLLRAILQKMDSPSSVPDISSLDWTGPQDGMIQIICVFYSSLAASLLAAFVAMLGKQWLNRYERVGTRGSVIERARERQIRTDGMSTWNFHLVMESLSVMLQMSVLLLGYALSQYLWTIDKTVADVIIGVTSFGVIFYAFIVIAGVMSYNCPFQTPASLFIRSVVFYEKKRGTFQSLLKRLVSSASSSWRRVQVSMNQWRTKRVSESRGIGSLGVLDDEEIKVEAIFKVEELDAEQSSDIRCASWLMINSTDADVTLAAVRFVPDLERHASKATPSLARLYDALSACFDSPDDFLTLEMKAKSYDAAKVFLKIYTQRRCISNQDVVFQELSLQSGTIPECPPEDADLHSILDMVREVVQGEAAEWTCPKVLQGVSLSHLSWISHILVYRVWESCQQGMKIPHGVHEFLRNALTLLVEYDLPALEPVIADFLLTIGLTVGLRVDSNDLLVADKSSALDTIISRLYDQLNTSSAEFYSEDDVDSLLAALKMMNVPQVSSRLALWSETALTGEDVASPLVFHPQEKLFRTIMGSRITDMDKLSAASLVLQLAFQNQRFSPYFKDPLYLMTFLDHHFGLERAGEHHAGSIADAFEATSSPFLHPPPDFDITQMNFLESMGGSLRGGKPIRLRLNSLFFINWIGSDNFDAAGEAMEHHQRSEFCANFAAIYTNLRNDHRYVTCYLQILLRMANSPIWRPYMRLTHWGTLELLYSRYPNLHLEPLNACLCNEGLIPSLSELDDGDVITKLWLRIIWRQPFETLSPKLINSIRTATLEVLRRDGEAAMDEFEGLINPGHDGFGAFMYAAQEGQDPEKKESIRRRESMFQQLCDEAVRMLSPGPIADSPLSLGPTELLSDE